jgi:hypothetical protein
MPTAMIWLVFSSQPTKSTNHAHALQRDEQSELSDGPAGLVLRLFHHVDLRTGYFFMC